MLNTIALEQDKCCCSESGAHLVHCMESQIVLKSGQQEKLHPSTDVSILLLCSLQLLPLSFKNHVHNIFRNKISTLEINVIHFRCCIGSNGNSLDPPLINFIEEPMATLSSYKKCLKTQLDFNLTQKYL